MFCILRKESRSQWDKAYIHFINKLNENSEEFHYTKRFAFGSALL